MLLHQRLSSVVRPQLLMAGVVAIGGVKLVEPTWRPATLGSRVAGVAKPAAQSEPLGPPLAEPMQIISQRGVVELTLEAAPAPITVAGQTFISNVYNGQYIPPVFRLRRGEELQLRLINKIGPADVQIDETQGTNLHYHGMSISPRPPADDIYITIPSLPMIEGGEISSSHTGGHTITMRDNFVYEYRWQVPEDHAQGALWYHSHAHGQAEPQILSGLSGMFIIEGLVRDYYPWLAGVKERVLLLKDIELPGADDGDPKTKTINGQTNPTIAMPANEPQLWWIGNVGADSYFDLELEGHTFWVLDRDGNILDRPVRESHLLIPPGARYAVFVEPTSAGKFRLHSRAVDTGPQGDPNPEVVIATVAVDRQSPFGTQRLRRDQAPGIPLPTLLGRTSPLQDLRRRRITGQRTITFSESADGDTFYLEGRQWDPDRIDTTVQVGDVEEWTILNTTGEVHAFHIHQLDFLVT